MSRFRFRQSVAVWTVQAGLLIALLLSWETAAANGWFNPTVFGRPSDVAAAIWPTVTDSAVLHSLRVTLVEALGGFLLATVAALLFATTISRNSFVMRCVSPFLAGLNSVPRLALAPLFVVWFGFGQASKIALVFSLCFFVVTYSTLGGLLQVDPLLVRYGRTLGLGRAKQFRAIELPAAASAIFAGMQLALANAFVGAVIGEMLAGSSGLGTEMQRSLATFDTSRFFAVLGLLVLLAMITSSLLTMAERRVLRWRTG